MIVDADVIVAASLGRSLPLFQALLDRHVALLVPEDQLREARLVTATQAARQRRDPSVLFTWTTETLLAIPSELFDGYEAEARARLRESGQKDWSLVALALASGDDIWSNDLDLFGTGIAVWNTRNISRAGPRISSAPTGTDRNENA